MVPSLGCTASWPPFSLPIAQGDPTSLGPAVTELLRPLRCTLPIGWIGGRYTTSNPILAMRGSALAAVANVPCTGLPFLSQPPVDRGNISYQALKRASRPIHPDAVLFAAGDLVAQRILREQLGDLRGQRRARAGERVARLAEHLRGFDQRIT